MFKKNTIRDKTISFPKLNIKTLGLILGPAFFLAIILSDFTPKQPLAVKLAASAALMAILWITEAIPLAATSLIPIIIFPILGIMNAESVAGEYANSTIFLFLGGFLIAIALEKWDLHKRISLIVIRIMGSGTHGIVLGFMTASCLLSMIISNTATAIMMMPIGLTLIKKMEEKHGVEKSHNFAVALMLGIAYSASIGGIATLVGTVPNLVFQRIFALSFESAPSITFGIWLFWGIPISLIMLFLTWIVLVKFVFKPAKSINIEKSLINKEYHDLGRMSLEEVIILIIVNITAFLWIFRKNLLIGDFMIPGWSESLPFKQFIDDGTIAIIMAFLLFLIPSKNKKNGNRLLDADSFVKIPWDIILLFGGGFALAKGFQDTGLSKFFGEQFSIISGMPTFLSVLLIVTIMIFLTELTSNTAVTQTMLPILASISVSLQINPMLLMVPATIAASFAFMMPVGTPPNAIVFGTGRIRIPEMAKVGLILNFIGIAVIASLFYLIGEFFVGLKLTEFPVWGNGS